MYFKRFKVEKVERILQLFFVHKRFPKTSSILYNYHSHQYLLVLEVQNIKKRSKFRSSHRGNKKHFCEGVLQFIREQRYLNNELQEVVTPSIK